MLTIDAGVFGESTSNPPTLNGSLKVNLSDYDILKLVKSRTFVAARVMFAVRLCFPPLLVYADCTTRETYVGSKERLLSKTRADSGAISEA